MRSLKRAKNVYVAISIFCIVGGILLLIWPGLGLDVLCKISGVFFLIYGLAKISSYFSKDLFQELRVGNEQRLCEADGR